MRIDRLFKVLVVGGSALTAGCGGDLRDPSARGAVVSAEAGVSDVGSAAVDVATARDVVARADGVSSWMSWFVDPTEEDAGPAAVDVADAGVADVGSASDAAADASGDVSADDGVLAWLSWV